MNIACGIEYDGTEYHGFQRQPERHGATVQGALEAAIERISSTFAVVQGAGRTDAGVHASGQVINFQTAANLTAEVWQRALNALLPKSIAVRWAKEVPPRFHARFSALSRSYRYTIWNDRAPTALQARYTYHYPRELDVDLMDEACHRLLGCKDFGAFGQCPEGAHATKPGHCIREMLAAHCARDETRKEIIFCDFTANAFLTGQVRRMVGTLLLVGQKRLNLQQFAEIVQNANQHHPGPAAPAHGLCLVRVAYPEMFGVPK
jgi:tRNA pseudouridine38-40 synthase